MWQLERTGELQPHTSAPVNSTLVELQETADGRMFSLARSWKDENPDLYLQAQGALIPDQVAMAFAMGIDSILLSDDQLHRYGKQVWRQAAERFCCATPYSVIWQRRTEQPITLQT